MGTVVYFLLTPQRDKIKIGCSETFLNRLSNYLSLPEFKDLSSKWDINVLGVMAGNWGVERTLIRRFKPHCIQGREWFRPHRDIVEFIMTETQPFEHVLPGMRLRRDHKETLEYYWQFDAMPVSEWKPYDVNVIVRGQLLVKRWLVQDTKSKIISITPKGCEVIGRVYPFKPATIQLPLALPEAA